MFYCSVTASVAMRQHTPDKTTTAQNTEKLSFSFAAVRGSYVQILHIIINRV